MIGSEHKTTSLGHWVHSCRGCNLTIAKGGRWYELTPWPTTEVTHLRFVPGFAQTLVKRDTLATILYVPSQQCLGWTNQYVHYQSLNSSEREDYLPHSKTMRKWECGQKNFCRPQMTTFGACLHLTSYCSNSPGLECSHSSARTSHTLSNSILNCSLLPGDLMCVA